MRAAYRLTPKAKEGLNDIAQYVAENFGLRIAEKVLSDIERSLKRLAKNPSLGHKREDLTRNARVLFWAVGPTLVAYREGERWIEILFIERGELDWESLLAKRLK